MRVAQVLKLKPGQAAAYKKKHDEIWPELVQSIKRRGISNFSIYRYGDLLFAYREVDDDKPAHPQPDDVQKRWQEWMAPHLEPLDDQQTAPEELEEMFHID